MATPVLGRLILPRRHRNGPPRFAFTRTASVLSRPISTRDAMYRYRKYVRATPSRDHRRRRHEINGPARR